MCMCVCRIGAWDKMDFGTNWGVNGDSDVFSKKTYSGPSSAQTGAAGKMEQYFTPDLKAKARAIYAEDIEVYEKICRSC